MSDPVCGNAPMKPTCKGFSDLRADNERLRARIVEHEQFRHQHRDCDAMSAENQSLRARVAALSAAVSHVLSSAQTGTFEGGVVISFAALGAVRSAVGDGERT